TKKSLVEHVGMNGALLDVQRVRFPNIARWAGGKCDLQVGANAEVGVHRWVIGQRLERPRFAASIKVPSRAQPAPRKRGGRIPFEAERDQSGAGDRVRVRDKNGEPIAIRRAAGIGLAEQERKYPFATRGGRESLSTQLNVGHKAIRLMVSR